MAGSTVSNSDTIHPSRVDRETAIQTTNTIYAIFLGIIFALIFQLSQGPAPQAFLIETLPLLSVTYCCLIFTHILLLWLCDNFYVPLPESLPDIVLILNLLRVAAFGTAFVLAMHQAPAQYLMFGVAALIDAIVLYHIYKEVMAPAYSDDAKEWLESYASEGEANDSKTVQWAIAGLIAPKIWALLISAIRLAAAIGIILISLAPIILGKDPDTSVIVTIYVLVSGYVLIQFCAWLFVFRKDLGRQYAEMFQAFQFHQRKLSNEGSTVDEGNGGSDK